MGRRWRWRCWRISGNGYCCQGWRWWRWRLHGRGQFRGCRPRFYRVGHHRQRWNGWCAWRRWRCGRRWRCWAEHHLRIAPNCIWRWGWCWRRYFGSSYWRRRRRWCRRRWQRRDDFWRRWWFAYGINQWLGWGWGYRWRGHSQHGQRGTRRRGRRWIICQPSSDRWGFVAVRRRRWWCWRVSQRNPGGGCRIGRWCVRFLLGWRWWSRWNRWRISHRRIEWQRRQQHARWRWRRRWRHDCGRQHQRRGWWCWRPWRWRWRRRWRRHEPRLGRRWRHWRQGLLRRLHLVNHGTARGV